MNDICELERNEDSHELAHQLRLARARIEVLLTNLRQMCWYTSEGSDYLYCGFCEGSVRDGAGQARLDTAHDPDCPAALRGEEER